MESTAALFTQLLKAIESSQWLLVVPLAVLVAVYLVRRMLARAVPWIATDQGGASLSIIAAAAQAVAAAAVLPGPHTVVSVLSVAVPIFMANEVVFRSLKKLGVDLSVDPPAQFETAKPASPAPSQGPDALAASLSSAPAGSDVAAKVWNKTLLVALLLGSVTVSATGCALFQRAGRTAELAAPKLLDCTSEAAVAALPTMFAEVGEQLGNVINRGSFDVEPVIDELIAKGKSPWLPCVIAAVLQSWMQAGSGAGAPLPDDPERARLMLLASHVGQAHLLARGHVCR